MFFNKYSYNASSNFNKGEFIVPPSALFPLPPENAAVAVVVEEEEEEEEHAKLESWIPKVHRLGSGHRLVEGDDDGGAARSAAETSILRPTTRW